MKRNYASSLARWGRFAAAALGVALLPAYLAAAEYVRVFEGPDPDAIYLRLFAGDPSIVEVGGRGEAGEAGAVAVRMPGFSSNRSAGDPILPYGRYRLALPPDADPASLSLEVVNVVEERMPGTYRLAPVPPPGPCQELYPAKRVMTELEMWGIGKEVVAGKNVGVYESDEMYPAEICNVVYGGQLRKWKIAAVTFYPMRYNPVKRELFLVREVDVVIHFERDAKYLQRPEVRALLRDEAFDDKVKGIIQNYDRALPWYRLPLSGGSGGGNPGPEDPNYAVVTTEDLFGNLGSLGDFCFHKEDQGYDVLVVTEHQTRTIDYDAATGYSFVASPGGYEDVVGEPAPGQRPDKIYQWLRDNYAALGIVYVLLIGDPDPDNPAAGDLVGDLPMKDVLLSTNNDVPTDFYFAELTGTWDLDGDGNAGEFVDDKGPTGVEFYADVVVGRIPVYDEDQDGVPDYATADAILDKTTAYEAADTAAETWRRSVLTSAPYVADTNGDDVKDAAKYHWSEMLMDNVAPPPLWDWYRIYEEAYGDVFPPAEVDTGCSYVETQDGWNDLADPDDGRGVVMWMTHGWRTFATKVFNNARCANLDDSKPSIVFMGACHNGEPELDVDPVTSATTICLGYRNLQAGAVATISASRDSYG